MMNEEILSAYRALAFSRCDGDGTAYYFSASDFEGLRCEGQTFRASAGHTLQGYFYFYEAPVADRLIVFEHGLGGGHRSYLREIERLCAHGFRVFAYDHTGCMESGGAHTNGLAQSLSDLSDCMAMLAEHPRYSKCKISVVGHSWGGFSAMNISALYPHITHAVAISGYRDVEGFVDFCLGGMLGPARDEILRLEREANPRFSRFCAEESLLSSSARVLLIHAKDDPVCSKEAHFDLLRERLKARPDTRFLEMDGKGHNPNYTHDAVEYLGFYAAERARRLQEGDLQTPDQKAAFVASFDWRRMTAQDEAVWREILACLDEV